MSNQKGFSLISILLGVITVIGLAGGAYYLGKSQVSKPQPQSPVVISQTPQPTSSSTTNEIDNFSFTFKYGVRNEPGGPRNILNTSEQTYTKDMVFGQDVTTKLSLTNDERNQILQKVLSISLFDLPNDYSDTQPSCKIPYSSYDLTVVYGSTVKHLSWIDHTGCNNENPITQKLNELSKLIISFIKQKQEYKNLPSAQGGYL